MTTSLPKIDPAAISFARLHPRGKFYFSATTYNKKPLIFETPSLITPSGIQPDGARSFLDLELDVASNKEHQKLYDIFKDVDDRCIDVTIENMKTWFKGSSDVDENFIEEQFKSPITPGWGNEPNAMRVELVTETPEDIVDKNGNVLSPSDVTSLSSVRVKLQLLGLWISKEFLGCHWRAIGLVVDLDHETKGRRRHSSPRRASPLPPVTSRASRRPRATSERPATTIEAAPAAAPAAPTPTAPTTPTASAASTTTSVTDTRHTRVAKMLEKFKEEDNKDSDSHSDDDSYDRHHDHRDHRDDHHRRRSYSDYDDSDYSSDDDGYDSRDRRRSRRDSY